MKKVLGMVAVQATIFSGLLLILLGVNLLDGARWPIVPLH